MGVLMSRRKIVACLAVLLLCVAMGSFGQSRRGYEQFPRRGACFFKDNDFHGDFFCVRDGEGLEHMPPGFNDRISSIRLFGGVRVRTFKDSNFRGKRLEFRRSVRDLAHLRNTNDTISSVQVR